MVADYTSEKDRGKGMAMNGVAWALQRCWSSAFSLQSMKKAGVINLIYIISVLA